MRGVTSRDILSSLRELHSLVIAPGGGFVDRLVLHLIRIGCHVQHCWPPPQRDKCGHVQVMFTALVDEREHNALKRFVESFAGDLTVIAVVDYESPTVLEKIIDLEAHGVIMEPFDENKVLPTLVTARLNTLQRTKLIKENGKYRQRLRSSAVVNRAKVLLMTQKSMTEAQAHEYLSQKAMKSRRKISDIANEIMSLV
ncbi:ANTAR domain-containing response regulator [Salinisphaera sp. RV14]|uniref:ANTAR domain-containing response regulator n=1 Tax=unclassified Salinisphaera TaxID=2649847 RepID=UPI003F833ADB